MLCTPAMALAAVGALDALHTVCGSAPASAAELAVVVCRLAADSAALGVALSAAALLDPLAYAPHPAALLGGAIAAAVPLALASSRSRPRWAAPPSDGARRVDGTATRLRRRSLRGPV